MNEIIPTSKDQQFHMTDMDRVVGFRPQLSDNDGGVPPVDGGGDDFGRGGGGGGGARRVRVTFSGKAFDAIMAEADQLGLNGGDFVRKSVKLGILAARASRKGSPDFRFETFFHEDDMHPLD